MTIRSNAYFNNPQFAQAASSLASLFAPPSGADAAGWATANAKKEEASRLAQLFTDSQAAEFDQARFDRGAVAAGVYAPSQSYYSVDLGDSTARRGQDITAATSRSNNAADNARALQQTKLTTLADFYDPLNEGQVRPELPADIAGMYGVDRALPAEQGRAKPLSETEFKAQILQSLDPSEQRAAAMGSTPVEEIVTPDGPQYAWRTDSVGKTPHNKDTKGLDVQFGPDGKVIAITQGGAAGGAPKLTEQQSKDTVYFTRGVGAIGNLDKHEAALTEKVGYVGSQAGVPGNFIKSTEYQLAEQAGKEFLQAILRKDTGAAITPQEQAEYGSVYLPQPGDKPELIAQKRVSRQRALAALKVGIPSDMILALEKQGLDISPAAMPKADAPGTAPAAAAPAPTPSSGAPQPGAVEDGYRFKGGDPNDAANWERVQ